VIFSLFPNFRYSLILDSNDFGKCFFIAFSIPVDSRYAIQIIGIFNESNSFLILIILYIEIINPERSR